MIYLLRHSDFRDCDISEHASVYTKTFQHIDIARKLQPYLDKHDFVGEIGPHANFSQLMKFVNARKCVIDPYNGAAGAGMSQIPGSMPYGIALYRCLVGVDSHIIPSILFGLTFSISVLEHIGQQEVGYDCNPTESPPPAQEVPRDAFCREMFRITAPGGVTIHTIDHAARNLTFVNNFLSAGFKPLAETRLPTLNECLEDPDVVRQQRDWVRHDLPMPLSERRLHGVLMMAFRRPS